MMATHLRALDLPVDHHLDVILLVGRKVHLWRLASKVQYAKEFRVFGGAAVDEAHGFTAGLGRGCINERLPAAMSCRRASLAGRAERRRLAITRAVSLCRLCTGGAVFAGLLYPVLVPCTSTSTVQL